MGIWTLSVYIWLSDVSNIRFESLDWQGKLDYTILSEQLIYGLKAA